MTSAVVDSRFVKSMNHTLKLASQHVAEAENNPEAREELKSLLEQALDIIQLHSMLTRRPMVAALTPPELS